MSDELWAWLAWSGPVLDLTIRIVNIIPEERRSYSGPAQGRNSEGKWWWWWPDEFLQDSPGFYGGEEKRGRTLRFYCIFMTSVPTLPLSPRCNYKGSRLQVTDKRTLALRILSLMIMFNCELWSIHLQTWSTETSFPVKITQNFKKKYYYHFLKIKASLQSVLHKINLSSKGKRKISCVKFPQVVL